MKAWVLTVAFCAATVPNVSAAAVGASGFELTGLFDLGSSRIAFLTTPDGEKVTLHLGEEVAGYHLRDMNAKAGWVSLQNGTNETRLRLTSYVPAGGSGAKVALKPRTFSTVAIQPAPQPLSPAEPFWSHSQSRHVSEFDGPVPTPQPSPGAWLPSGACLSQNSTPTTSPAPAVTATPARAAELPSAEIVNEPMSSPGLSANSEAVAPALTPDAPAKSFKMDSARAALFREGELVRARYGDGGFNAWSREQYLKSRFQGLW